MTYLLFLLIFLALPCGCYLDTGPELGVFDSYPIYANHMQGTVSANDPFTTADYDSIATLDVYFSQMELFGPKQTEYIGFVDSLRIRNPQIVVIDYAYAWGIGDTWQGYQVDGLQREYYNMVEKYDLWMRDANGERVPYFWDAWSLYLLNVGHPDYADLLSTFFADYINASENAQDFTGIYFDYFDFNRFANWACTGGCQTVIDMNQNGKPYKDDPEELKMYQESQLMLIDLVHKKVNNKKFIVMANGSSWRTSKAFAQGTDGGVWERMRVNEPLNTEAEWMAAVFDFSNPDLGTGLLNRPIVIYDEQGSWEANEKPLLALSLATLGAAQISTNAPIDGRRFWCPLYSDLGKISLGDWVEGGLSWPAFDDTLYRQFELGYIKMIPSVGFPYEYCVVDTASSAEADTLFKSRNWPRQGD